MAGVNAIKDVGIVLLLVGLLTDLVVQCHALREVALPWQVRRNALLPRVLIGIGFALAIFSNIR